MAVCRWAAEAEVMTNESGQTEHGGGT